MKNRKNKIFVLQINGMSFTTGRDIIPKTNIVEAGNGKRQNSSEDYKFFSC